MNLNTILNSGKFRDIAARLNENFSKISTAIDSVSLSATKNKGLFPTVEELKSKYPNPSPGDWAVVGDSIPGKIYRCETAGSWMDTGKTGGGGNVDLAGYAKKTDLAGLESSSEKINQIGEKLAGDSGWFNVPISLSIGSIGSGTSINPSAKNRLSSQFISIEGNRTYQFRCNDGYQYFIGGIDASVKYEDITDWMSGTNTVTIPAKITDFAVSLKKTSSQYALVEMVLGEIINGSTDMSGNLTSSDTRIITKNMIRIEPKKNYTLRINPGYNYSLIGYGENGQLVNDYGWSDKNITDWWSVNFFRIAFRRTDDGAISPDDFAKVGFSMSYEGASGTEEDFSESDIPLTGMTIYQDGQRYSPAAPYKSVNMNDSVYLPNDKWVRGTLQSDGSVSTPSSIRLVTKDMIDISNYSIVRLKTDSRFKAYLMGYTSSGTVVGTVLDDTSEGVYRREPNVHYIRISLRRNDGNEEMPPWELGPSIIELSFEEGTLTGSNDVIINNKDKESAVIAASIYYNYNGDRFDNDTSQVNFFEFAFIADTHGHDSAVSRFLRYSQRFGCIDCAIHGGDIVNKSVLSDYNWFNRLQEDFKKPFLIALGNHDQSNANSLPTISQLYDRFYKPYVKKNGIVIQSGKTYFYRDFSEYKVRVIVLNACEIPSDSVKSSNNGADYYKTCCSQEQVNFLLSALKVENEWHVVIVTHYFNTLVRFEENPFTTEYWYGKTFDYTFPNGQSGDVVLDILTAYKNKTAINKTYTYTVDNWQSVLGSVTVDIDFATYNGTLVGAFVGHQHCDTFGHLNGIPVIAVASGTTDLAAAFESDTPRINGTKTEDSFNIIAIDTVNKKIKMVKIGADMTYSMNERKYVAINY